MTRSASVCLSTFNLYCQVSLEYIKVLAMQHASFGCGSLKRAILLVREYAMLGRSQVKHIKSYLHKLASYTLSPVTPVNRNLGDMHLQL